MARSNTASRPGTVVEPKGKKADKPSLFDHVVVAATSDTAKDLGKSAAHGLAFGTGVVIAYKLLG